MSRGVKADPIRGIAYVGAGIITALVGIYLILNPEALTDSRRFPILGILLLASVIALWRANALLR